jgi:hypothetical protein
MNTKATQPVKPKSVQDIFKNPNRWIKHQENKTKKINGKPVECFCLIGAIFHVYGEYTTRGEQAIARTEKAIKAYELNKLDYVDIPDWNDKRKRTVIDVQRVAAIAKI